MTVLRVEREPRRLFLKHGTCTRQLGVEINFLTLPRKIAIDRERRLQRWERQVDVHGFNFLHLARAFIGKAHNAILDADVVELQMIDVGEA